MITITEAAVRIHQEVAKIVGAEKIDASALQWFSGWPLYETKAGEPRYIRLSGDDGAEFDVLLGYFARTDVRAELLRRTAERKLTAADCDAVEAMIAELSEAQQQVDAPSLDPCGYCSWAGFLLAGAASML